ncbi:MAG: Mpo1-like protein [Candidatus Dormibacteria bacterium]
MRRFTGYNDFFPHYVAQHSRRATRWVHFAGTHSGAVLAIAGARGRRPGLLAAAPVTAYGAAWLSHALIERNRPATFGHPLWSLRGDLQMLVMMWRGRDAELAAMAARHVSADQVEGRGVQRAA